MDESIISGNNLIAKFMGDKWIAQTKGTSYLVGNPKLFHSSWDWLMPALKKYGEMPVNESSRKHWKGIVNVALAAIDIDLTWKFFVAALQELNQNKKP